MNMALLGAGLQFAGGIFGGRRRDKRAMRQLGEIQDAADLAVQEYRNDQNRIVEIRDQDEARLRAASGVDFAKLRDDAVRAGFNPLTALNATGGAGYDGRGAVLQTPFVSIGDAMRLRVDARLGAMPSVVQTAGYFGDALSGLGDSVMTLGRDQQAREHDARMYQLAVEGATRANAVAAGAVNRARDATFMQPTKLTASPRLSYGPQYSASGVAGQTDEFGFPERYVTPDDTRATKLDDRPDNSVYDVVEIWGEKVYDWNDQASDSEIGAFFSILTWPAQVALAKTVRRQMEPVRNAKPVEWPQVNRSGNPKLRVGGYAP